jgi:hypothetical protein
VNTCLLFEFDFFMFMVMCEFIFVFLFFGTPFFDDMGDFFFNFTLQLNIKFILYFNCNPHFLFPIFFKKNCVIKILFQLHPSIND